MSISQQCFYFCQLSMFSIHSTILLEVFTFQEQANILSTAFGAHSLWFASFVAWEVDRNVVIFI